MSRLYWLIPDTEDLLSEPLWKCHSAPKGDDDDDIGKLHAYMDACTWRLGSVTCYSHSPLQTLLIRMKKKMRKINLKVPMHVYQNYMHCSVQCCEYYCIYYIYGYITIETKHHSLVSGTGPLPLIHEATNAIDRGLCETVHASVCIPGMHAVTSLQRLCNSMRGIILP